MITIASWNINSVKVRQDAILAWLAQHKPDFVLLQEIKCKTETFPAEAFRAAGYQATVSGQPAYNGVAILSRHASIHQNITLVDNDPQARFLHIVWNDLHIINVYCPNGNPIGTEKFTYKLHWMETLQAYCRDLLNKREKFLVGGDFNIIPEPIDAAHPEQWANDALFQPESRKILRGFLNMGLADAYRTLHPTEKDCYTFWDYQAGSWQRNNGIRIDHFLLSPYIADRLETCWVDKEPRGRERPSDHTPIVIQITL